MHKKHTSLYRIAVTMGDPAGVGPEICLRLLHREPRDNVIPVVYGDIEILTRVAKKIGLHPPPMFMTLEDWALNWGSVTTPMVVNLDAMDAKKLTPGHVTAETGAAAYQYIEAAIACSFVSHVQAVTTAPIHKEALRLAGVPFPGHTEIFAAKNHTKRFCMMLTAEEMTCTFATLHVGYREVPDLLTEARILETIELTHNAMRTLRGREPNLTVLALNPHAGEGGLFGDEEQRLIIPAMESARKKGIRVEGPLPPDTAFLPERQRVTDAYVCMYHDQGHIPLKMVAFDRAVNITLGLPIIRTSVGHGTALDVAWKGTASPNSLFEAFDLAVRLVKGREA